MARATPVLLAIFFAAATVLLIVAAITLLAPGGPLDAVWRVAEDKFVLLRPYGELVGPAFLALAIVTTATALGCLWRRRWGWRLAVAVIAANAAGDAAQVFTGRVEEGVFGVAVAGVGLIWLTRRRVRDEFLLAVPAVS